MITCEHKNFNGRMSCVYDRPYRLSGVWEAALISFTHTNVPVYILCDIVDYSEVNQQKVQLLDYFYSSYGIKSGGRTQYMKLLNKRFNSINIDVKTRLSSRVDDGSELKEIFIDFKEDDEISCLIHFRRIG
jgi:hypothetical protein